MVPPDSKPRRVLIAAMAATLAIFAGLVTIFSWQFRRQLREGVLRRESEAVHAVALMQLGRVDARLAQFSPELLVEDLFAAVLESSKLRGVIAVQLFDPQGKLRRSSTIPPEDAESTQWWPRPLSQPAGRFVGAGLLEQAAPMEALRSRATTRVPLLEIAVPLQGTADGSPPMVARYWIDGAGVAAEFKRMDGGLLLQAGIVFVSGAALVVAVLAWASARLAAANRRLVEQSADLARANHELDFAAKTGALGAISAHLIHGLKNPLAGLEGFVAETASGTPDATRGEACRMAMETTQRLRALVTEVTTVLRDETDGAADYAVPVAEVVEAVRLRAADAAETARIRFEVTDARDVALQARVANLTGLVLANLLANAIEASPRGGSVAIEARAQGATVEFAVRDTGPGLPPNVRSELFRPVRSAKRGGGGVGLAISLRLAKHAGGNLELVRTDATGTEFRLTVPTSGRA